MHVLNHWVKEKSSYHKKIVLTYDRSSGKKKPKSIEPYVLKKSNAFNTH